MNITNPFSSPHIIIYDKLLHFYKIGGTGTVPVRCVKISIIKPVMVVTFTPAMIITKVKSVEMLHKSLHEAGETLGFNIKFVSINEIRCCMVAGDSKNEPKGCKNFTAQFIILNHLGSLSLLDTLQFWIIILLTLLVNSLNLKKTLTGIQIKRWKATLSLLKLEMPSSQSLLQANPCVLTISLNSRLSDVLLYMT